MSYYSPCFLDSVSKVSAQLGNNFNESFYVYPIKYTSATHNNLLIFNLPSHIKVYIQGLYLSSSLFDYFNPLLLHGEDSQKFIKFYDTNLKDFTLSFDCFRLYSHSLMKRYDDLNKYAFYYPPGYTINYLTCRAYRALSGQQICDCFYKSNGPILSLPPLSSGLPSGPGGTSFGLPAGLPAGLSTQPLINFLNGLVAVNNMLNPNSSGSLVSSEEGSQSSSQSTSGSTISTNSEVPSESDTSSPEENEENEEIS